MRSGVWMVMVCACAVAIFSGCGRNAPPSASNSKDTAPEEVTVMLPGDVPLVLMKIPAGSFIMGCNQGEQGSYSNETLQHTVNIAYDFYMGKYEVTQAQWLALMGSNPSHFTGDLQRPVEMVSWDDTQNFIAALNKHTGMHFRLPSEAEWEYACRAGTATRFYFGDSLGCDDDLEDCAAGTLPGNRSDFMWYRGNSEWVTHPVGGKLPNAFGLYDMHGNVLECCQDWIHDDYTGAPADGSAWETPTSNFRVYRGGGCYFYSAGSCRSAYRSNCAPGCRNENGGLRVVRTL